MLGHGALGEFALGEFEVILVEVYDQAKELLVHATLLDGFLERRLKDGISSKSEPQHALMGSENFLNRHIGTGTTIKDDPQHASLGNDGFLNRRLGNVKVTPRRRTQ